MIISVLEMNRWQYKKDKISWLTTFMHEICSDMMVNKLW